MVVAVAVVVVIGPGITDRRASDAAHDRPDRAANDRSGDSAANCASDRAVLIGETQLGRDQEKRGG